MIWVRFTASLPLGLLGRIMICGEEKGNSNSLKEEEAPSSVLGGSGFGSGPERADLSLRGPKKEFHLLFTAWCSLNSAQPQGVWLQAALQQSRGQGPALAP